MKVLAIGYKGLVGSRFVELYSSKFNIIPVDRDEIDITNIDSVRKVLQQNLPDLVINFAAYTNVGEAETQRGDKSGDAWRVNVAGVSNVVLLCKEFNIPLIHFSTDFVFEGRITNKGPYKEEDPICLDPSKINWYGFTKASAEKVIVDNYSQHTAIIRISYPYRVGFERLDFARSIVTLYSEGKLYPLFSDQIITPTYIDEVARVLELLCKNFKSGIFHVASKDTTTPYEFGKYLIQKLVNNEVEIKGALLSDMINGGATLKPIYGGLSCEKTQRDLGIGFKNWREYVDVFVEEYDNHSLH